MQQVLAKAQYELGNYKQLTKENKMPHEDYCYALERENHALNEKYESLRQQLAAALAACKLKDSILERLIAGDKPYMSEYQQALALQPDDSALKAWLGEPVAWKHDSPTRHDAITSSVKELLQKANSGYLIRPLDKTEHYTIPLYAPKGLNHGN